MSSLGSSSGSFIPGVLGPFLPPSPFFLIRVGVRSLKFSSKGVVAGVCGSFS